MDRDSSSLPSLLVIQRDPDNPSSMEIRSALLASILNDITVSRCELKDLARSHSLLVSDCLPIGSVEFVREAAAVLRLPLPLDMSYPASLRPWLFREVERTTKHGFSINTAAFIKPANQIKAFSGFLYPGDDATLDDYAQSELASLQRLADDAEIWVSEPVSWVSEWRYYVCSGSVVGKGRYDDGPDDAPMPDEGELLAMIRAYDADAPISYGLDVGVLEDGRTALVEVNDAWALGLYRGSMSDARYLNMLWRRWRQLREQAAFA